MYKIKLSFDNKPYWVFVASNGLTIANSETYNSREACLNGIRSSKASMSLNNFEVLFSTNNKYYFVQKANNHEVLCKSELYETKQMCVHGIDVLRNQGPSASVF